LTWLGSKLWLSSPQSPPFRFPPPRALLDHNLDMTTPFLRNPSWKDTPRAFDSGLSSTSLRTQLRCPQFPTLFPFSPFSSFVVFFYSPFFFDLTTPFFSVNFQKLTTSLNRLYQLSDNFHRPSPRIFSFALIGLPH